jgi:hypothetical protein
MGRFLLREIEALRKVATRRLYSGNALTEEGDREMPRQTLATRLFDELAPLGDRTGRRRRGGCASARRRLPRWLGEEMRLRSSEFAALPSAMCGRLLNQLVSAREDGLWDNEA